MCFKQLTRALAVPGAAAKPSAAFIIRTVGIIGIAVRKLLARAAGWWSIADPTEGKKQEPTVLRRARLPVTMARMMLRSMMVIKVVLLLMAAMIKMMTIMMMRKNRMVLVVLVMMLEKKAIMVVMHEMRRECREYG